MLHPLRTLPTLGLTDAAAIVNEPVFGVTPIGQGSRSRVYRVETEDGAVRIIRLTPKGTGRLEREAWVRAQFRTRHPDVPLIAEIAVNHVAIAVAADVVSMAELPGTTMFAAARTLFEPEVQTLYAQFGAGLAALHSVPVQGFGLIDASGRGGHVSWREAFAAIAEAAIEEARVSSLEDYIEPARATLATLGPTLDGAEGPLLLHGDAQPMNIHVHRGKINAFFDFEFASGGDPAYELAYVEPLFEPSPTTNATAADLLGRRAAFYAGYAKNRVLPPEVPERTRLYRLVHALRGTEFLSVVGPQLAAPVRDETTRAMRASLERWLATSPSLLVGR